MKALDSSVVVAALLGWHVAHERAEHAAAGNAVPAHALLETYSVLTRLPAPHRLSAEVAGQLLVAWFPPNRILVADDELASAVVGRLSGEGISGGAAYDALIGLTADQHGRELLTLDERATILGELKERLRRAIESEQFEIAADLRDKIRVME